MIWQTIKLWLIKFLEGALDPTYKADLEKFRVEKAAADREVVALKVAIAASEAQRAALMTRRVQADGELARLESEADALDKQAKELRDERAKINVDALSDTDALRSKL